ncbi:RICIN domain-containing protein [Kitasatospora aureofaciens]|uniref:RICIN domain-containing protein n=1 Tax=Kitasatospora aureofaciens TaxID=1894 RepID=UPI0036F492CB
MSQIPAGRSYRIKNKGSGLYLNVVGNSNSQSAQLEQYRSQSGAERAHQVWHVFPLDFGHYLLANKSSGYVANIVGNSTSRSALAEQYRLQDVKTNQPAQQWLLRDAGGGTYEIINNKSQLNLNVVGFSTSQSANVEQYIKVSGANFDFERWLLEPVDEYKPILDLRPGEDSIGDIIRLTGYANPTPSSTTPVLVGSMAYPFPLVTDPAYSRERQARENPYYIMRKYGYWTKVYYYEHGGASEYTHKETTRVGLTSSSSTTVEETTSISVTAEASFAFKGFGASLSSTFTQELKVTTTETVTEESSREVEITRTYAAKDHVAEAIWYRDDKYVLERLDGSKVLEWTTRDPNTTVADAYRA